VPFQVDVDDDFFDFEVDQFMEQALAVNDPAAVADAVEAAKEQVAEAMGLAAADEPSVVMAAPVAAKVPVMVADPLVVLQDPAVAADVLDERKPAATAVVVKPVVVAGVKRPPPDSESSSSASDLQRPAPPAQAVNLSHGYAQKGLRFASGSGSQSSASATEPVNNDVAAAKKLRPELSSSGESEDE